MPVAQQSPSIGAHKPLCRLDQATEVKSASFFSVYDDNVSTRRTANISPQTRTVQSPIVRPNIRPVLVVCNGMTRLFACKKVSPRLEARQFTLGGGPVFGDTCFRTKLSQRKPVSNQPEAAIT
jgi:hypothetical protein